MIEIPKIHVWSTNGAEMLDARLNSDIKELHLAQLPKELRHMIGYYVEGRGPEFQLPSAKNSALEKWRNQVRKITNLNKILCLGSALSVACAATLALLGLAGSTHLLGLGILCLLVRVYNGSPPSINSSEAKIASLTDAVSDLTILKEFFLDYKLPHLDNVQIRNYTDEYMQLPHNLTDTDYDDFEADLFDKTVNNVPSYIRQSYIRNHRINVVLEPYHDVYHAFLGDLFQAVRYFRLRNLGMFHTIPVPATPAKVPELGMHDAVLVFQKYLNDLEGDSNSVISKFDNEISLLKNPLRS